MEFGFNFGNELGPADLVLDAALVSVLGITLLLAFIVGRRWIRARYFARRERLMYLIRQHWEELLAGGRLPVDWRFQPLTCEVLESMLLDSLETARPEQMPRLVNCLRQSGLVDKRIDDARQLRGWRRRKALVALGRTRSPEAIPALAEALDDSQMETRIAAARGLGKIALPEAAVPMLDRFCGEDLQVPWAVLRNAILNCCRLNPGMLIRYLHGAAGEKRELLARVLAENSDLGSSEDLILLAGDPSAEIRASAARGLARVDAETALPALAQLASDPEWFVRLRAVVSLSFLRSPEAATLLIRALRDSHREVRQRAAWALIRSGPQTAALLRQVVELGDNYGLQAVVAELERCGRYEQALESIRRSGAADAQRLRGELEEARLRLGLETATEPAKVGVA